MSATNVVELPFTFAFHKIWNSIDEFFLCVGMIIITVPIVMTISSTSQHYFRFSLWTAQMLIFLSLSTLFLYLLSSVAGESTSVSMLQGFALGVGYALQPYIVSLLSGTTFFSTGMLSTNDIIIVDGSEYTIVSNGILFLEAKHNLKDLTIYIPNNFFNSRYIKKKNK
mgnify:CR=1 FL=1|tara:strand:+ start:470 stop:973 length:504 start_codon:yes stop_codon:yes gene_type:complete